MKRQALFATLWSSGELVSRQGLQFAATLVLARLLTPSDFGVMAMLAVFTGIASVLADAGLSMALVQRQDVNHEDESSVFWFNLGVGALLAIALYAAAPLLAAFYAVPVVKPLARLLALALFASSAGSIHFALLSKRLDFRSQAKAGGIAALLAGTISIVMAFKGFGVWALAAQAVLMSSITTILLWMFNPWRPAFVLRRASLEKLLGFGVYQLVNALMEMTYTRLYAAIIGKWFGATKLGYYANADTTRQLPASFLGGLVSRVALPMFSRANGDPAVYRRGIQLAIRMTMLINAPVVAVMVALAHPLLQVVFGRQWLPAAPLLQILALAVLLYPLHAVNIQALMSTGEARLMVRVEVIKKIAGVLLLLVGAKFGLAGIAWSQVVHSVIALIVNTYFTRRWFGYGGLAQFQDVLPSIVAALGAGLAAVALQGALDVPVAWSLLASLALGGCVYLALLAAFGRGTWSDASSLLVELRR